MRAGEVYVNPASGERAIVVLGTDETKGDRLVVDLHLRPKGVMLGRHYHPAIHEQFRVLHGSVAFTLNGKESKAAEGESVDIPPGTLHDFWNPDTKEAVVRVSVQPAARFVEMIKNGFSLAQDGKTDAKGMPGMLQISLFAQEFDDVIRYDKGPRVVQKILFGVLAPIARWKGLKGNYPEYLARPASEIMPVGHLDRDGLVD
jgi:quercetin dioxygenase-like cupin family protein